MLVIDTTLEKETHTHTHTYIYHSNYIFLKPQIWNKKESENFQPIEDFNNFSKNIFYLSKLKLM